MGFLLHSGSNKLSVKSNLWKITPTKWQRRHDHVQMAECADRERWAWRMLPICRPCFPPHKCRSPHPWTTPDEYSRCDRLGFQICEKRQNTSNQGNIIIQKRLAQLTRHPLWLTCPWAGQSHLSSSAQWERGLLERHSGTSHSPLPAPPHFWAASQRLDALEKQDHHQSSRHDICNYYIFVADGPVTDSIEIRTVSTTLVIHCNG